MNKRETSILIIDDDNNFVEEWVDALRNEEFDAEGQCDPRKVATQVRHKKYHIVLLDIVMPQKNGIAVLLDIRTFSPESKVIVFSGGGSTAEVVACLKHGACDYIAKYGSRASDVIEKIELVIDHPELVLEEFTLRENLIKSLWRNVQLDMTNQKGEYLQMLMKHIFDSIPGFSAESNMVGKHEEIDVWIENNRQDNFWKELKSLVLVECKNWATKKPGPDDFNHFYVKVCNHTNVGCTLGFFVSYNGFTDGFLDSIRMKRASVPFVVPIGGPSLETLISYDSGEKRVELLKSLVRKVGSHKGDLTE